MADYERLRPFARRPRSNVLGRDDDMDNSSSLPTTVGNELRPRLPTTRMASLEILVSSKLGSKYSIKKSLGSPSASRRPSPSSAQYEDGVFFQERDYTDSEVSTDNMINTLHSIMMTKPALQPVPVEHNSSILHLLEGYWRMQEQLKSAEQALAKERETKERSLDEFTNMAAEWEGKEAGFRAEIKRMELVLAKVAPEGVGAVVLARSGSVLDRSRKSSKMFKSMFRMSESPEKGQNSKITKTFDESLVSTHSGSLLRTHSTILTMRPVLDRNADVELSEQFRVAREKQDWPTGPTKPCRLSGDAERKAEIEEKNPPTEDQYTKLHSAALESPVDRSQTERLLKRCRSDSEASNLASSRPDHQPSKPCRQQREFSFNPGEDGILSLPTTGLATFGDRRSTKETGHVNQTIS